MQVSHGAQIPWEETKMRHRGGGIAFKHLLLGEEGNTRNFRFDLARQTDFHSPRHKHNFEQFRYAVQGSVNLGPGLLLKPGMLAYHPEGTPYGPQEDDPGEERIVLVLQFGGASRQGYLSARQTKAAQDELLLDGRFEGGRFHKDGMSIDGFQALWEHANQKTLTYPRPRYVQPILVDPTGFSWTPVPASSGSWKKTLGVFEERQVVAELLHVEQGAKLEDIGGDGIHLLFVTEGAGRVGAEKIETHSAIQLTDGRGTGVEAQNGSLVLLHFFLSSLD